MIALQAKRLMELEERVTSGALEMHRMSDSRQSIIVDLVKDVTQAQRELKGKGRGAGAGAWPSKGF